MHASIYLGACSSGLDMCLVILSRCCCCVLACRTPTLAINRQPIPLLIKTGPGCQPNVWPTTTPLRGSKTRTSATAATAGSHSERRHQRSAERERDHEHKHTPTAGKHVCWNETRPHPPLKPATLAHTDFVGAVREVAPAVKCIIPGAGYVADTLPEPIDVDISSTAPMFGVYVSTRVSGGAKMMSVWCVSREREGGKGGGAGLTARSSWAIEQ